MKYKYFSLGFLCALIIGCTVGAAMQVTPRTGRQGVPELKFATVVEIKYTPPGLLDAIEQTSNSFLNDINPGLSDEMKVYRHNMSINGNGQIIDRVIYVRKTDE